MEEMKARRVVDALRDRGTDANLARVGVYQFGVSIKLPDGREATWDSDGTAALEAQVMRNGVLVGFVPAIDGSDEFTEEQILDAIVRPTTTSRSRRRRQKPRLPPSHSPARAESSAGSWTASGTAKPEKAVGHGRGPCALPLQHLPDVDAGRAGGPLRYERAGPGTYAWTNPHGLTYTSRPTTKS